MVDKTISIDEARARVLAEASPLPAEERPIEAAFGYVLAEGVVSSLNVPPFDNSAMDGFAVFAADVVDAGPDTPVALVLRDTIPAGYVAEHHLNRGETAKIMTGAPMPQGANAVVQSELASEADGKVLIFEAAKPGLNVRRTAEDIAVGDRVLAAGAELGPAEIGVLASLGLPTLKVFRRPRVAVLSTGSELVEVDQPLAPGKIRNSNSYALQAYCQQIGVEVTRLGIAPDDYDSTLRMVEEGLTYDVLITSGGVSVGEFDFVKNVQDALGVERRLWGVAMKPGKPLVFGVKGPTLVFGLPGNPVSAMVSFELFVKPALLRLMGHKRVVKPLYKAIVEEDVFSKDGRTYVVRVRAWREDDRWHVSSTGPQGSGILRSMVGANGLIFVPGAPKGVRAGQEVDFLLLREDLKEA
ncbi:MAG TPA: gephyrin-like molybdotransferase Glp [Thermoleophilia bacterium]